jgi:hypothetical protein
MNTIADRVTLALVAFFLWQSMSANRCSVHTVMEYRSNNCCQPSLSRLQRKARCPLHKFFASALLGAPGSSPALEATLERGAPRASPLVTCDGSEMSQGISALGGHAVHPDVTAITLQGRAAAGCYLERASCATPSPPRSSHAKNRSESNHASSKSSFHCIVCPPGVNRSKFRATQQAMSVLQDLVQWPDAYGKVVTTLRTLCPGQDGYDADRMSPLVSHSRWLVPRFCGVSAWHPSCSLAA